MTVNERSMTTMALSNLLNMRIINDIEFNLLNEYYTNDERPFNLVKDEIIELANDKNYRDKIISHLGNNINTRVIISVIDFRENEKDFFQVKYNDGTSRIEENIFGKPAEQVFNTVVEKFSSNPTKTFEMLMDDIVVKNKLDAGESNGKTKVKRHPNSIYKMFEDDAAFMNILFFIFLTGVSSGIIMMIILNLMK
ncbi:MAG: hypothetical protein J6D28_04890 [Bacilli bacterium]|nr:hypothetical protein [Bacilli bacterium]